MEVFMAFKVVRGLCKPKVHFKEPSLTRQEFSASADMNYIVSKFLRTGQVEQPNLGRPMVDGLEYPNDFTEACNLAFEQRHEEIIASIHENDKGKVLENEEKNQEKDQGKVLENEEKNQEKDQGKVLEK